MSAGTGAGDDLGTTRAWVVVAGGFISTFTVFGVAYSFGAFFEDMAAEFGGNLMLRVAGAGPATSLHPPTRRSVTGPSPAAEGARETPPASRPTITSGGQARPLTGSR